VLAGGQKTAQEKTFRGSLGHCQVGHRHRPLTGDAILNNMNTVLDPMGRYDVTLCTLGASAYRRASFIEDELANFR
jgi:hypothetical protein